MDSRPTLKPFFKHHVGLRLIPPFATHEDAEAFLRSAGQLPADPTAQPLLQAREIQHRYLDFLADDPPAVAGVVDEEVQGPHGRIPVRLFFPQRPLSRTAIVFVRGGGLWAGTLDGYSRTMAMICSLCSMPVCGIDYRLAPEFSYPVQQDEVEASVRWLLAYRPTSGDGIDGVVLWGESAGASLAVCAALDLRAACGTAIRGLVLLYGNFAGPRPDSRPQSAWAWRQYLRGATAESAARAVPLNRDLRGLPPAWLGVGDADPLIGDSLSFARGLDLAGVRCELRIYEGMPHSFVMLSRILQPAVSALHDAARAAAGFAGVARPPPDRTKSILGDNHARQT